MRHGIRLSGPVAPLSASDVLSGYGRPSNAIGTPGAIYTDLSMAVGGNSPSAGWQYTKSDDNLSWKLTGGVVAADGYPPVPFRSSRSVYCSPYLLDQALDDRSGIEVAGNIHGSLNHHGSAWDISSLEANPTRRQGADGSDNFAREASPTNGAKKCHRITGQRADAPTFGGNPRTRVVFGNNMNSLATGSANEITEYEWSFLAFSLFITPELVYTAFDQTAFAGGENQVFNVMQFHQYDQRSDVGLVVLGMFLHASWFRFPHGEPGASPPSAGNGNPPRLSFDVLGQDDIVNPLPASTGAPAFRTGGIAIDPSPVMTGNWFHFGLGVRMDHRNDVGEGSRIVLRLKKGSAEPLTVIDSNQRFGVDMYSPNGSYLEGLSPGLPVVRPGYGVYDSDGTTTWREVVDGGADRVTMYAGDFTVSNSGIVPVFDATALAMLDDAVLYQALRHQ